MELQTERLLLQPQPYGADGHVAEWQVVERTSSLVIGRIGFFGREQDALIVGYEIANEWRGRGFATESLRALLSHTDGTVIAETEADHLASRRVMEKAGMDLVDTDGPRVRYALNCAVPSTP